MTDIEQKALALLNEATDSKSDDIEDFSRSGVLRALLHAIEQHEAFRQEVSDAVEEYFGPKHLDVILAGHSLARFIIPKPVDPLVEAMEEASGTNNPVEWANRFYAAIEKRGGKIVWGEG